MEHAVSQKWRTLSQGLRLKEPLHGLDALWHKAVGLAGHISCSPCRFLRQADKTKAKEKDFLHVSDRKLRFKMEPLRERFRLGRDTPGDRHLAFAIVCEVAERTVGLRPYREQIAAALSLDAGCVAEMATGEGKTLVAAMCAVIAGWRGRGCHVITSNDYLAQRDAESMGAIYRFCSLTVGRVMPDMAPVDRRRAYDADITYGTNKEVAADFLRDRLLIARFRGLPSVLLSRFFGQDIYSAEQPVQRGLEYAIVDEADSVFIDDAVTPLLISAESSNPQRLEAFRRAAGLAGELDPAADYSVDPRYREVRLTPSGRQRLTEMLESTGGLWASKRRREELVTQALVASAFFIRDKHYVISGNKVVIVDESTGRLMPDRTWRHGIHQAIEAKEGLEINLPKETQARISFQRFFRLYRHLSGMSGTVDEARAELWQTYRLPVVPIPTHRPCRRLVMPDRVFATAAAKWAAVTAEIVAIHKMRRPVLVGTSGIRECEYLSEKLSAIGLSHRKLNAVRQAAESRVISEAGKMGQITVATNMAGRGTDIRLGVGVAKLGGLHVIATERFEARRIDRQLSGRCARQGDPGSAQAFICLEDELFRKHSHRIVFPVERFFCYNNKEITSIFWQGVTNVLQRRAERVSSRMRRDVLAADNWLEHHLGFAVKDI